MSQLALSAKVLPILLPLASNVFMAAAWYRHLRFKTLPLFLVILTSWGTARQYSTKAMPQLKTMQEAITLIVFAGFAVLYLKEPLGWNHALGYSLIALGAFFVFQKWS